MLQHAQTWRRRKKPVTKQQMLHDAAALRRHADRQQTGLCQGLGEGWGVEAHRGQRFSLGGREVLEVLLLTVDLVLPTCA